MMTPSQIADQLIAECVRGFRNEHHWKGWMGKHREEIKALPIGLRNQVQLAHDQATHKAFSVRA